MKPKQKHFVIRWQAVLTILDVKFYVLTDIHNIPGIHYQEHVNQLRKIEDSTYLQKQNNTTTHSPNVIEHKWNNIPNQFKIMFYFENTFTGIIPANFYYYITITNRAMVGNPRCTDELSI